MPALRLESRERQSIYDRLVELLQVHEDRPYAIMMGRRQWVQLTRDPRAGKHIISFPGDPDTFMHVPVRIEGLKHETQVFATAQDLHDELYPPKEK